MRSACPSRRFVSARGFGATLALAGLCSCASYESSIEKQLAKLHDDVTRLQAETDRMGERMEAMEARSSAASRSEEKVASAAEATLSRPKLKVVRVEPDAEPTAAAAAAEPAPDAEGAPRVVIQGEGKTLETRTLPGTQRSQPKPAPAPAAQPAKPASTSSK
jgi:hypothetical protein